MAVVMAALGVSTRYTAVAGVWRWAVRENQVMPLGMARAIRLTLRNAPFRHYLPSFVLFSVSLSLLIMLVPFYVTEVLGRSETWVSVVLGTYVGGAMLALPVLVYLAGRLGKRVVYQRSLLLSGLIMPLVFVAGFLSGVPPTLQLMAVVTVLGMCSGAVFVFPMVIMAEIIDHDEVLTSYRREGIYYGVEQGMQKVGIALGTFLFGVILEAFGSTADDPTGLRIIGPLAGALTLAGYLVFSRGYRLESRGRTAGPAQAASEPAE
jgi:oligogalacturonide transporter